MSHVPFNPIDPSPAEYEARQTEYRDAMAGNRPLPSLKRVLITTGAIVAALGLVAILLRIL